MSGGRFGFSVLRLDVNDAVLDHHGVRADRKFRRRRIDGTSAKVETGGMQRAFDLASLHPTVGQRCVLMRTGVVDRQHLAVFGVKHRDGRICFYAPRFAGRQFGQGTDLEHSRMASHQHGSCSVLSNTMRSKQQCVVSHKPCQVEPNYFFDRRRRSRCRCVREGGKRTSARRRAECSYTTSSGITRVSTPADDAESRLTAAPARPDFAAGCLRIE